MKRSLIKSILEDLKSKIVLVSGPRQVGKTTLSKNLLDQFQYLNFDSEIDRKIIHLQQWDRSQKLIIFDELHKKPKWKAWIKGVYDKEGVDGCSLLVTGSARMDIFKKGSDSLAGRHFSYRLHPFSVAELKDQMPASEILERILLVGGFPEPFLKNSETFARRWRKTHLDKILKEDLIELERIRELKQLELLVDLLSERVGSPISYSNLARDLEVSPHTIKKWIGILEAFYIVFVVYPYSKNLSRAILKEPKIYFYDNGKVKNDKSLRLENAIACALLKDLNMREDLLGEKNQLHYVRDREKREVDFLVVQDKKVTKLVEVKLSDQNFSKSLAYFQERIKADKSIQVVLDLNQRKSTANLQMISAVDFLSDLEDIYSLER